MLTSVCSPSLEECAEDNVGGPGPTGGQHQAQCGQTGGQSAAVQHSQHQCRTHKPQHTGSHTSEYQLLHVGLSQCQILPDDKLSQNFFAINDNVVLRQSSSYIIAIIEEQCKNTLSKISKHKF